MRHVAQEDRSLTHAQAQNTTTRHADCECLAPRLCWKWLLPECGTVISSLIWSGISAEVLLLPAWHRYRPVNRLIHHESHTSSCSTAEQQVRTWMLSTPSRKHLSKYSTCTQQLISSVHPWLIRPWLRIPASRASILGICATERDMSLQQFLPRDVRCFAKNRGYAKSDRLCHFHK